MATREWIGVGDLHPVVRDVTKALFPLPSASAAAAVGFRLRPLRAPPEATDQAGVSRSKLWQLAPPLHCSIIGTCLTTGELRSLLRKFKASGSESATDHDLHGVAVSAAGTRSPLSKQIQKALDHRHSAAIRRFAKATTAGEIERLWDDAKQSGDIPGAYWAALTHPAASDAVVRHVFGDVHMLSHLVGAANRADIRRLHQLEREKAALEEKLARQQLHLRDSIVARDAKIRDLGILLAAQIERTAVVDTGDLSSAVETLRGLVADLRRRLEAETERRKRAEQRATEHGASRATAERERLSLERELEAVRRELDAAELTLAAEEGRQDDATLDLGGATLLYVGGRPRLAARLKDVIERAAGRLIHHDGGIEQNTDLLAGHVSRADIVFFPVDCISHDSAQSVKRLSRQFGKPFIPLRSSSIASLLHALRSLELPGAVRGEARSAD